jgi:3-phosphoshikimate 1-carboxyvinyltransferase
MRAGIHVEAKGDVGGEPVAEVHLHQTPTLVAGLVGGETVTRAIDEVPIVCALAARASGTTRIRDAGELRVKESDRLATMAQVLAAFGVQCTELPDGLDIEGTDAPLRAAEVHSHGDHRIAMTAAVMGLVADGPTRINDAECITTSFPKFVGTLRALGADVSVEE